MLGADLRTLTLLASAVVLTAALPFPIASAQEAPPAVAEDAAAGSAPPVAAEAVAAPVASAAENFGQASGLLKAGRSEQEQAEGLRLLVLAADAGLVEAQVLLGDVLREGKYSASVDAAGAVNYYRRAADAGNLRALVRLGDLHRKGMAGLEPDAPQAAAYYEEAARAGDNGARRSLASMLLTGQGVPADPDRAVTLLEIAFITGENWAAIELAIAYRNGQGVVVDAEKAVSLLEPLVAQGNAAAMNTLGDLYRAGAGTVGKDPAKAYGLFGQAAGLGDQGARKKVGDMLIKGEGVAADFAGGVAIFEAVAAAGDASALVQAGDYHARPEFGHVQAEAAIGYYRRAVDAGSVSALVRLGDLYRKGMTGQEPDAPQAAAYFDQAAGKGDNGARRSLAAMLLAGQGVPADPDRAVELLEAAKAAGDVRAALELGVAWSSGAVLDADYGRAMEAFNAAIAGGDRAAMVRQGVALMKGPLADRYGDEGLPILMKAIEEGIPGARLELARLQLAGLVPGSGPRDAVETLLPAAAGDDVTAIRLLVGLYRDGASGLPPAKEKALALIEEKAAVLGPPGAALERLQVAAGEPWGAAVRDEIAASLPQLDPRGAVTALKRFARTSTHAYTYILQQELLELGHYSGTATGVLDRPTISAIFGFCEQHGIRTACEAGPLAAEAVDVIADRLFSAR